MSRKHHTKHARSASRYPYRLRARGESPASVRMPFWGANGKRYETAKDWHDAMQRRAKTDGAEAVAA